MCTPCVGWRNDREFFHLELTTPMWVSISVVCVFSITGGQIVESGNAFLWWWCGTLHQPAGELNGSGCWHGPLTRGMGGEAECRWTYILCGPHQQVDSVEPPNHTQGMGREGGYPRLSILCGPHQQANSVEPHTLTWGMGRENEWQRMYMLCELYQRADSVEPPNKIGEGRGSEAEGSDGDWRTQDDGSDSGETETRHVQLWGIDASF